MFVLLMCTEPGLEGEKRTRLPPAMSQESSQVLGPDEKIHA
jgi:hypothetical protein